ncbi:tyrosine-protein phosphatase [Aridibaculum aurantiacum]|uniref:tyrosine-protein phosphatase n=1 Tax=Aridibaculum aurantiacum TaxID=2810307 RepID=UPI001F60D1D3|nr:CpsB/CapC family capsule biosynthesis tyrosine phosphatase [Aridibaculum aurantiacum]
MHSHLLPGLDDGVKEMETSIAYIRQLHELGYSKLICTPHILSDIYPNSRQTILPKLYALREELAKANIPVKVEAAAEYMMDHEFAELVERSKKEDLLTISNQYILVEMSYLAASPHVEQIIFNLRMLGLQPILAHPERYNYYHHNFEQYERFKELGCKLQLNLLSLSGGYGPHVKKTGEKLLKNGLIDFVGTDMHHEMHMKMLQKLASTKDFYELMEGHEMLNKRLM